MNIKNLPLVIGIALPLVFIVVISLFVFLPSFFISPQHNFVYSSFDDYYYGYNQAYLNTYKVENGTISLQPVLVRDAEGVITNSEKPVAEMPILYIYDMSTHSSHQITFEEAKKLSLDPGPSSPDGYTVGYRYGHDGIFELFGSNNNNNGLFVSKGTSQKKLSGMADGNQYWYQGNFRLIGWVK